MTFSFKYVEPGSRIWGTNSHKRHFFMRFAFTELYRLTQQCSQSLFPCNLGTRLSDLLKVTKLPSANTIPMLSNLNSESVFPAIPFPHVKTPQNMSRPRLQAVNDGRSGTCLSDAHIWACLQQPCLAHLCRYQR